MRRLGALVGCLGFASLLLAGRAGLPAFAQSATPAALSSATGVTAEPVTGGYVSALPPGAGIVDLVQYRFAPGAVATIGPDAGSLIVVAVESGALTVESRGAATIQRAQSGGAQPAPETVAPGSAVRLAPGDSLVGLAPAGTVLRNEETADAVILGLGIRPNATTARQPASASPVASSGMSLALAVVIPPSCPAGTHLGDTSLQATPVGGGGGGEGGFAMAMAASPACVSSAATPVP